MMSEDPTSRTKWLMTLCAAFAIAFLFAIGTSACAAPPEDELPEEETAGGELPEYTEYTDRSEETDLLGLYDPEV